MIRLSQRHLKILETCPRQFEHIYFDRLTPPMSPTQQVKTQLGSDFHLLMQQRELGLPIEPILARSPQLDGWMKAIIATAPELFAANPQAWRESEHVRTIAIDNYLFTAIYDLVILTPDKADIIDWKTYPLPQYKKDLDLEWQTRLYLYTLAETSAYLPKQVNFTYWFIQSTPQPKSVRIGYTLKQHRQTEADIRELLRKLTDWLDAYQTRGEPFPQVDESVGACRYCNFVARCDRQQQPESAPAHPSHDFEDVTTTATPTHRRLEQIPAVPI
jgi:PD-(D/E)XK nuclease superfamily